MFGRALFLDGLLCDDVAEAEEERGRHGLREEGPRGQAGFVPGLGVGEVNGECGRIGGFVYQPSILTVYV